MRRFLAFLFCIACFNEITAKGKVNVILLVNDSKATPTDIRNSTNIIYLQNKIGIDQFTVFHFSNKSLSGTNWTSKKKSVDYKPILAGCNFSICDQMNTLISASRSEKTKLFDCNSSLPCDASKWYIELGILSNSNESTILEKIKEEITINKNLKKNLTLFFYILGEQVTVNPTISFEKGDTIEVNSGEATILNPLYSKDVKKVEWKPSQGLNCSDCKSPTLQVSENISYTISVTDSLHCKTQNKLLTVIVKNKCLCSNNSLKAVSDVFGQLPISKYEGDIDAEIADWQIASNQSGGFVFDLICNPNCASRFKVKIENKERTKVWEETYTRNQVDKRARNDYHQDYPDYFVFRLDLSKLARKSGQGIRDPNDHFFISILSYDDNNQECVPYESQRIIFSKCN